MSTSSLALVADAVTAVERLARPAEEYRRLSDSELLKLAELDAKLQRLSATRVALSAGEIARRSARELGQQGLAQRTGYRTPEELVRAKTGSTSRDASTAVRIGRLLHDSPDEPLVRAVVGAGLSVAAADAIRTGLGKPTAEITAPMLADAAARLCDEAATLDVDRLFRRARELRDELDAAGIADREAARRAQRSLRFTRLPDGMAQLNWKLDPESAAVVGELFDRATSPRRGGPRFVDPDQARLADGILSDQRTTEQLASDVFLELLRQGAAADSSRLLASGAPVVRVVVTDEALRARSGVGFIEGQPDAISIASVERLACSGAVQQVVIGAFGQPLDLGREQRLYNKRQRTALAIRDGGCMWPGCDRPPSWTEAHHLEHWARDHGGTDIVNGILLCRHHHLLLHNNGWEIRYENGEYLLVPPADVDPARRPLLMLSKSKVAR